ncbi:(Fe-S)-binding protein [Helicobacter canis]|uniref:Glycolate oxidase iron-sulfur subunit n=1 Tax=Helicobacter canis TaxID=29419 RepID=A0A377J347_9HELI|nr:(Fe-S)-binding protein [Helicobacter canis]STO96927.1 ferredoxin-type oxidoreductase [Helicobacter canis]
MIDFKAVSQACVKCGKCIPSCTIYQIHREEVTSPRGYLDLVGAYARGELQLDKLAKEYFESCFLCTTCVQACPSNLGVDVAIEQIRIDIAQQYGIAWYKRAYFFLLKHRKLMDMVFRIVAFISPCVFKQGKQGNTLPFSKRVIFPFGKKSFLNTYSGLIPASAPKSQNLAHNKVAIFIGCLANYNYQNVGISLLKILDKLGIDALVPSQECCGAPAFFTGDIASVLTLIKRNIEYFESFIDEVDAILIPEATCAAMLMHDWENALKRDEQAHTLIPRLRKLTSKMAMASQWLYHHTTLATLLESLRDSACGLESGISSPRELDRPQVLSHPHGSKNPNSSSTILESRSPTITYHDPCHAKKVLKIHREPRALLAKSHRIIEMSEPDRCCGFGGVSMQSDRYKLTLQAGAPKAQMIASTQAHIVSAECSACRMQLTNALAQAQVSTKFMHPLELIASDLDSCTLAPQL